MEKPRWQPFDQGQTINWYIFRQNRSKLTILVSTIGFSGMPDLVVGLEITLDFALLVKSKMADMCPRSNNILDIIIMIFFSHIGLAGMRLSLYHEIFIYSRPIGVIRKYCNYRIVSKILDDRHNIS